ncbi:hypothetical protein C1X64_12700 [Pseudomonas sp. GW456-E7]|nr:hypothetical protein C1X64_12700 [Pseudomonas sp. GW456-E7]
MVQSNSSYSSSSSSSSKSSSSRSSSSTTSSSGWFSRKSLRLSVIARRSSSPFCGQLSIWAMRSIFFATASSNASAMA